MSVSREELSSLFLENDGNSEEGFRLIMHSAELHEGFASDEDWDGLCGYAAEVDDEMKFSARFQDRFALERESPRMALYDNYILAAMAAVKTGAHLRYPVMAWAAFNKHSYPGLLNKQGYSEAAVLRLLHWGGADINAADPESGMTALHYLACVKFGSGSDPRIVKWLLDHGANPNARNAAGDTPLGYLSGSATWSASQNWTFQALVHYGADPRAEANDGSTPLLLLEASNGQMFSAERGALIDHYGPN